MIEASMVIDDISLLKDKLKVILNTTNGLILLVNDLLDFAQIANAKFRFTRGPVRISQVINEILQIFENKALLKGIGLLHEAKNYDLNEEVTIDENRLKQILFNLIGNAMKFTRAGYIKIIIEEEVIDEIAYLKFTIEDTGIGIKHEDLAKLFKLFGKLNQDDPSMNR